MPPTDLSGFGPANPLPPGSNVQTAKGNIIIIDVTSGKAYSTQGTINTRAIQQPQQPVAISEKSDGLILELVVGGRK